MWYPGESYLQLFSTASSCEIKEWILLCRFSSICTMLTVPVFACGWRWLQRATLGRQEVLNCTTWSPALMLRPKKQHVLRWVIEAGNVSEHVRDTEEVEGTAESTSCCGWCWSLVTRPSGAWRLSRSLCSLVHRYSCLFTGEVSLKARTRSVTTAAVLNKM